MEEESVNLMTLRSSLMLHYAFDYYLYYKGLVSFSSATEK